MAMRLPRLFSNQLTLCGVSLPIPGPNGRASDNSEDSWFDGPSKRQQSLVNHIHQDGRASSHELSSVERRQGQYTVLQTDFFPDFVASGVREEGSTQSGD